MNVDVYESLGTSGRYYFVEACSDTSPLPEPVKKPPFKTRSINSGDEFIGVSGNDVIDGINSDGYYAQDISVIVNEGA